MATSAAYKLKDKETLEQVAKSHKLQVSEIWKFGPNIDLVRKRRTPDQCKAGDLIELPPSKADRQAAIAKLEGVLKTLQHKAEQDAAVQAKLAALLADLEAKHKEWTTGLDKVAQKVKSDGDKADMANMLIGFAASGAGFVKGAREMEKLFAAKAKGVATAAADIEKLNHAQTVSAIEALYGPFSPAVSAGTTALSTAETSDNAFVSAIGTAADWFGQLTSPSGWAKFLTGVDKDLAEARRQIDHNYATAKSGILRKQAALQAEMKSTADMLRALIPAYKNMKKG